MKINTLVIDEDTVNVLSYASFQSNWFKEYLIPKQYTETIKRVALNGAVYLLSKKATPDSRLLVIKLEDNKLFSALEDKDKYVAFDRIISIALSQFGESISPGKGWGKYAAGQRISIYATHRIKTHVKRIYFDTNPLETNHVYAYDFNSEANGFENSIVDEDMFLQVVTQVDEAIAQEWEEIVEEADKQKEYGIELTENISSYHNEYLTVEQWYQNKLTKEQRTFVDKNYDDPVRLKGAAGTGKTLALAVKFLRDAYKFEDLKETKSLIFVTHSYATAQLVLDIIRPMDSRNLWDTSKYVTTKIVSLYDLAQEFLNYDLKKLMPLSADGREGRKLQYEIILQVIEDKKKDLKFKVGRIGKCSEEFKANIFNEDKIKPFVLEVLNEFACVLDAENISIGSPNESKYLNGSRESWQMDLKTSDERKIILELHGEYRKFLKEMDVLSMDQMIADFNRYLMSHEWNHICDSNGFDGVFVDELHCFTRPERMVFHELFKKNKVFNAEKLPLFMAYDVKQSIDDNFIHSVKSGSGSSLFKSTKVGKTDLVELTQVFRYTPEIAKFLSDIDGSFPALDLASEWNELSLDSKGTNGEKPTLTVYETDVELIDKVFKEASLKAKKFPHKTVAILCSNFDIFEKYITVGRIKNLFEAITSRDEVLRASKLKGKCIFSMPEYVAGLQFDEVYFIHLDKIEVDEDNPSCGAYRRFVSKVYLGSSRAKATLNIACSKSRQGPSHILTPAIESGSLIQI